MNINENIRNYRKMVENLREGTNNITNISAVNYSRLPKLVPNEKLRHSTLIQQSNIQILFACS